MSDDAQPGLLRGGLSRLVGAVTPSVMDVMLPAASWVKLLVSVPLVVTLAMRFEVAG